MQCIVLFFYTVLYELLLIFDKRMDSGNEYNMQQCRKMPFKLAIYRFDLNLEKIVILIVYYY